jgi:spore coat polysaccharide biosynthesis protein SpsF
MGSSRFPGKVLEEIIPGVSILDFLLQRLNTCRLADMIVVATTENPQDDKLVSWLLQKGVFYFRGSESDCLARYHDTCQAFGIGNVIRITADCPLVIPDVVNDMIRYYKRNIDWIDYLSNRQFTNFPEGLDVEIFSSRMLAEAMCEADKQDEREHINYFFLRRPSRYRIRYYNHNLSIDFSRFKLSIDTREDLFRINHMFQEKGLPHQFSLQQLMEALREDE